MCRKMAYSNLAEAGDTPQWLLLTFLSDVFGRLFLLGIISAHVISDQ